ncbi:MAG: bifunctional shikimate kinase/3-dehydroquinate synthase [Actinobacteria bacterium]|nr:bifunctional shikimate kinase/3-dehydroquinate synthase [Actinomycetota bacterium]
MGAGKTTLGGHLADALGRPFLDLDREVEKLMGVPIRQAFAASGETAFRLTEARETVTALRDRRPAVLALGGGAVGSADVRRALAEHALTFWLDVDVDEAWRRTRGSGRPLAQDELAFRALYRKRRPLYETASDVRAGDLDGLVLAAAAVHVEAGALKTLDRLLPGSGEVALVSDEQVDTIYGAAARSALGPRLHSTHRVPAGERAKTLATCGRLWDELSLERAGALVALGGGCTTDAAGFVAGTYLRGIAWVAVPTTLVGQVDAAIGGKTAINLDAGKNLVGAFHWPAGTVIDPALLETLPAAERRQGMSEVVKTGLLAGAPLWELPDTELVRRAAAYKAAVCLRDPLESGERAFLNLGHTFAHALETASGHSVRHGDAVALGLLAALRLSNLKEEAGTVEEVLRPTPVQADREAAWAALKRDKKARGGRIGLVLLDAPGKPRIDHDVPERAIRRALDELIAG